MGALKACACWIAVLTVAAAGVVNGGVVQGVVIEYASGHPMARTRVLLKSVSPSRVAPLTTRSGNSGEFMFDGLPEGLYLLTAMRDHYFPASFGQHLPGGQGTPFQVTADSHVFAELRMHRMGAITGRVLDENGIGLTSVPVVAYRARLPLRLAGRAESDDRGVYRIHGLDPGKYWVRTAGCNLDDGLRLLPTFAPEARESHEARVYPVAVDTEMPDADVRPFPGVLFRLTVYPQCQPRGAPVELFLSSETGRRDENASCGDSHAFEGLAPAPYEVYAETHNGTEFGFMELTIGRDEGGTLVMAPPPRVNIIIEGVPAATGGRPPVSLSGHRLDLAESGLEREIKIPQTTLAPGHWQISAQTAPGNFIESIDNRYGGSRRSWRRERPTDSFDVFIEARQQSSIRVVVSDKAGKITGTVQADEKGVPGIPVFIWPVAEQARRSLHGKLQTLSDVNGRYRFNSLPPGDYRLLATFDLSEADEENMDAAHAVTVHVDLSQAVDTVLTPWAASL